MSNVMKLLLCMCVRFSADPRWCVNGCAHSFGLQIDPLNGESDDIFCVDVVLRCSNTGGTHRCDTNRTGAPVQWPDMKINMMAVKIIGDIRRFSSPYADNTSERMSREVSRLTWSKCIQLKLRLRHEWIEIREITKGLSYTVSSIRIHRVETLVHWRTENRSNVRTFHFHSLPSITTSTLFFFASSYRIRCSANVFTAGLVIITWIWRRIASNAMSKCVSSGVKITQASPGLNASSAWR